MGSFSPLWGSRRGLYDAAGERTVKQSGDALSMAVNGTLSGASTGTTNFTAYVNPYTVINNGNQMSKHIYVGTQRIMSKLCDAGTMADPTTATKATYTGSTLKYADKYTTLTNTVKARYDSLGVAYNGLDNKGVGFYKSSKDSTSVKYFYHSDHLGSANYITDANGDVAQHLEYIPYGETFVDERYNNWHTPYVFNGKERDEETGLTYYGARYLDKNGVWLSVDPLGDDDPNIGTYVYCHANPVTKIDPDGRFVQAIVGGAIGALVDYGVQVGANYVQGKSNPWTNNINLTSIGTAAVAGALTGGESAIVEGVVGRTVVETGQQIINNTVQLNNTEHGVDTKVETNPINVAKNVVIDKTVGKVTGKVGSKVEGSINSSMLTKAGHLRNPGKALVKATGNNVTRQSTAIANKYIKGGAKCTGRVLEKTGEAISNGKVNALKTKTDIKK